MRCLLLPVLSLGLAGCTSVKQDFSGVPSDDVWRAMLAVAEEPLYEDWKVASNDVWVDEPERRIEVYRRVHRILYRPMAKPWPQKRAWRFEISFDAGDDPGDDSRAVFVSRGFGVPAHAEAEGRRYFADVLDLLSVPGGPPPAAPGEPPPAGDSAPQATQEVRETARAGGDARPAGGEGLSRNNEDTGQLR